MVRIRFPFFWLWMVLITLAGIVVLAMKGASNVPGQEVTDTKETSPSQLDGSTLITELGCNTCHPGLSAESNIQSKAPSLSHAGLRYQPAYLFQYLQDPQRVRNHIGNARMPNFNFSKAESLALSLFLETLQEVDNQWPAFPAGLTMQQSPGDPIQGKALLKEYQCLTCHQVGGEGQAIMVNLDQTGGKLKENWLREYIAAPFVYKGKASLMPSFFYQHNEQDNVLEPTTEEAEAKINHIASYLLSLTQQDWQRDYQATKDNHSEITPAMGERIFKAQNCASCHQVSPQYQWTHHNAPQLANVGDRLQKGWMTSFLQDPQPVRPFGFYPGSGSRMPNFKLSEEEVQAIVDHLAGPEEPQHTPAAGLSLHSSTKASNLLQDKLSCIGCHQIGDEGGKVGPSLNGLNQRLQTEYITQIIEQPHQLWPESVMPKSSENKKYIDLITSYLKTDDTSNNLDNYPSLIVNQPYFAEEGKNRTAQNYLRFCAPCHGQNGKGDGFNAPYLNRPPTKHADSQYMSQRTDDVLYDGIYAGGDMLDKSHAMPAWGATLKQAEILDLVVYLRKLCDCNGPSWSEDDSND